MIRRILTQGIGMKVVSLLVAIFLWFYVVVVLNPQTETYVRNIPVVIANYSEINNKNLILLHEPKITIDIQIKGTHSALAKANNKSITAVVDLAGNASVGEHAIPIQMNIPISGITIIRQNVDAVTVNIDAMDKKNVPLVATSLGEIANGYVVQSLTTSSNSVAIEGPRTVLQLIEKAEAVIDISGAVADVSEASDIELLSGNNVKIDDSLITKNISQVNVMCKVVAVSENQ